MRNIIGSLLLVLVLLAAASDAQLLTTKCPNDDWTHYLERCYLVVNFQHSWENAKTYCNQNGARLVEPTGYTIHDEISNLVATNIDPAANYWTGYTTRYGNGQDATVGYWSDREETSVEVGVWGLQEPDIAAGHCAYVDGTRGQWFMGSCDMIMPFVCEMDPCPEESFMCNGRCVNSALKCDGKDDCGNGLDEQDCPERCAFTQAGDSGTVTLPTIAGVYENNANCLWTLTTSPGKRLTIQFDSFTTEADTDVLEIWDGGPVLSAASVAARLSGDLPLPYTLTSSHNYLLLRFVSDGDTALGGFSLTWTTEHTCTYHILAGKSHTDDSIVYSIQKVPSRKTTSECTDVCSSDPLCYGFRYARDDRRCYLIGSLPLLKDDVTSDFYVNTCPKSTTIQASVPVFAARHTAEGTTQQLSTPGYPLPYPGIELDYTISAPGNNLVTLEVTFIDLSYGDTVDIYDGTTQSHTLLERLGSSSEPHVIISTGTDVYIRMSLESHWKSGGVLINFRKGCDIELTGTDQFQSPGFGTAGGYPGVTSCTWTLLAPAEDRSISLQFETFDLESDMDFLTIIGSDSEEKYTGSLLPAPPPSIANIVVRLETSAVTSGSGFKASFSPGCPNLASESMNTSIPTSNYGDVVTVTCADGYSFTGDYNNRQDVTLTCAFGGSWDIPVPLCAQGVCGPPPDVDHAIFVSSTGTQGGDTVSYQCIDGYNMTGDEQVMCRANDQWTEPPECTSVQCRSISEAAGTVTETTVLYGNGTGHGSVVRLGCSDDREIYGAATIQCRQGGWDFVEEGSPSACYYKPCETVSIPNGDVVQPSPYYTGQALDVVCRLGYALVGNATFLCGAASDLPTCQINTCSKDEIRNITNIEIVDDDEGLSSFGDDITVTCRPSYELVDISTRAMVINCQDDGTWSHSPSCRPMSCGKPQQVIGAVDQSDICTEFDCQFHFSCKERFVLLGISGRNDTTVRCGATYDGLWDFGNLRCTGGQCPDPGYPPSGRLIGESFAEGATVKFECLRAGYIPLPVDALTCLYNADNGQMEWDGNMPVCTDKEKPVIMDCPSDYILDNSIRMTYLDVPNFAEPFARDNNAVKTWEVRPENYRLTMPAAEAGRISYTAWDYSGNAVVCSFNILIPSYIECQNDKTIDIVLNEDKTYTEEDFADTFMTIKSFANNVTYTPSSLTLHTTQADLRSIHAVSVASYDPTTGELKDTCTLQFRMKAPACVPWSLDVPDGRTSCSGLACAAQCNSDHYFMEAPEATSIDIFCSSIDGVTAWNRTAPICAKATIMHVIYKAAYNFKYLIADGVSDVVSCGDVYRQELSGEKLSQLLQALEGICNLNSVNPVSLELLQGSPDLNYETSTKRLSVRLQIVISLADESVLNAPDLKDACSESIKTAFNTQAGIEEIKTLSGSASPFCGAGTYDLLTGTPSWEFTCEGFRKYFSRADLGRLCLDCPVGYSYDVAAKNCIPCPAGRYGVMGLDGAVCVDCPDNMNPGLTGRISAQECRFAAVCEPGTFSKDGLAPCKPCPKNFYNPIANARTCTPCLTDRVTLDEGAKLSTDCKLQSDLGIDDITPCNPNPCGNGGTCTFVQSDYKCTCTPGHTGDKCETEYNACSSNPCENGKACLSSFGSPDTFMCLCNDFVSANSELSGTYCEIDDRGCENVSCQNNGTCHNMLSDARCKCPPYIGYKNDDSGEIGECSTLVDPCVDFPCDQGTCIPHDHFYRSCDCYPGYTGTNCSQNIDDCALDRCRNGATCVDGVDSFQCRCADGYHGLYCQFRKACDRECDTEETNCHTCVVNNTDECANMGDGYTCSCLPGYTGTSCEIQNDVCNSYPCQHGGACTPTGNTFKCQCPDPWTGTSCETEINRCQQQTTCPNGGECFSTPSGTVCSCLEGYIGAACTEYDICDLVSPCLGTDSQCSYTNGQFHCECADGYTGAYCETQLPSCSSNNPCQNEAPCSDDNGVIDCDCASVGFTGEFCEDEVDRCDPNPCSDNQECVYTADGHDCPCISGKRGASCTKDVDGDFDYVIVPMVLGRPDVSAVRFGDGQTPINNLTVSFHARYTHLHHPGTILNIYGATTGETVVAEDPYFRIRFGYNIIEAKYTSPEEGRVKRQTVTEGNLEVPPTVDLTDGYWHTITLTWSDDPGEINLYIDGDYVDQEYFLKGSAIASSGDINIGFLVFGEFDTVTGMSVPSESFEGRISRLYVLDATLNDTQVLALATSDELPVDVHRLLNEERTTMLQYAVDYNSEVTDGVCTNPAESTCPGRYTDTDPTMQSCSDDVFIVSPNRESTPSIPIPTIDDGTVEGSILPGVTVVGWGVYGVSFAAVDTASNIAVCSYRLFNRPVSCSGPPSYPVICDSVDGGHRCQMDCPGSSAVTGDVPLFQTCSIYGMWDEDTKLYDYEFPKCAAELDMLYTVTLAVEVSTEANCQTLEANYQNKVLQELNTFNSQWNDELCGQDCFDELNDMFECTGVTSGSWAITFSGVSSPMIGPQATQSVEDVLKIAVADDNVFAWNDAVAPVLSSLDIAMEAACPSGYMISKDSCVQCGSGTFYDATTASCVRCGRGSYSGVQGDAVSECTPCHESQTTAGTGSTSVSQCIANCLRGQYYGEQQQQCIDCPVGFYSENDGSLFCTPCPVGQSTSGTRTSSAASCVPYSQITTSRPTDGPTAATGATTEDKGLSVGAIVAIVLSVILVVAIVVLIVCFCVCKDLVPCFAKKTTEVVPEEKGKYYVNKYGETHMRFVSYNLQDVRDKKKSPRSPYDKMPIVEAQSDESGSVKTDISVHVPVFLEKLDGRVSRKSTYMSNGSARGHVTSSPRSAQYNGTARSYQRDMTPRTALPYGGDTTPTGTLQYEQDRTPRLKLNYDQDRTPRHKPQYDQDRTPMSTLQFEREEEEGHYENLEPKKRRRKKHRSRKASRPVMPPDGATLPKALSPMPQRLRSMPPSEANIRPSSAMNEPRAEVQPADYRDFVRYRSDNFMSSSFDDGRPPAPMYDQPQIQVESDDEDLR